MGEEIKVGMRLGLQEGQVEGELTRWGQSTGDFMLVHAGEFQVTEIVGDQVHLADWLGRAPSVKHGHWVRKADLENLEEVEGPLLLKVCPLS